MTWNISDKRVQPHVFVAYHTMYKSAASRAAAVENARLVELALPHFRKLLNLPGTVRIRIAGIKGTIRGRYYSDTKFVLLDSALRGKKLLSTLAHELVHAEQYHTGKLTKCIVPGKGWMHQWEGSVINNRGRTYKAYRAQPWEVEAFARQEQLADQVWNTLTVDLGIVLV